MTIHTNRCKHCSKTKEEHPKDGLFTDSGLAALDAHKEELYEVATKVLKLWLDDNEKTMMNFDGAMIKLESILNQIEKEK